MVVRELFGKKGVNIEISDDDFPTKEEIEYIDNTTGKDCQHGWYKSSSSNKNGNDDMYLHYRYWLPPPTSDGDGEVKGVVVFTHGISSHTGHASRINDRPLNVALVVDTFTSKGMAVYARDQYGHGFSEGTRFFIPDWKENRDDLIQFVKLASDKNPKSVPLFMSGESYGGALTILASRYFQDYPNEAPVNFDSILLVAPAIEGDVPKFPVYQILRYVLAPIAPKWIPFFMPNAVSADRLWSDKKVFEYYKEPRRVEWGLDAIGDPFRIGTAVNMVQVFEEIQNKSIPGYDQPFCIVHGDGDVAVPMSGSELLYNNSTTANEDKEFHIIKGSNHEVLAEPQAEEAMKIITDFVDVRMEKFTPK